MKKIILVVVLVEAALLLWYVGSLPRIEIRRAITPEPHSIAEVRLLDRFPGLDPCHLPAVSVDGFSTRLNALSGSFTMLLPGRWRATQLDTTTTNFHTPEVTFTNERETRVTIVHDPSSSGRSFIASGTNSEPMPARDCETVVDSSGAIWTFYPPDTRAPGPRGGGRVVTFGDAVTSHGQRYRFRIGTWSESERDSLAAIISSAVVTR